MLKQLAPLIDLILELIGNIVNKLTTRNPLSLLGLQLDVLEELELTLRIPLVI